MYSCFNTVPECDRQTERQKNCYGYQGHQHWLTRVKSEPIDLCVNRLPACIYSDYILYRKMHNCGNKLFVILFIAFAVDESSGHGVPQVHIFAVAAGLLLMLVA